MAKVTMPQLGESVAEGTIGRWLKKPGDRVEKYEPIVEVVTDKVNAEVPSPFAGILTAILAEEGATVPNNAEIAEIETSEVETVPAPATAMPAAQASTPAAAAAPAGAPPATAPNAASAEAAPTPTPRAEAPQAPLVTPTAAGAVPSTLPEHGDPDARMTPAVRRLLREHGLSAVQVPGTGGGGRITRDDVLAVVETVRTGGTAPAIVAPAGPTAASAAAPARPRRRDACTVGPPRTRVDRPGRRLPAGRGRGPRADDEDAEGDRRADDAGAPRPARVRPRGGGRHEPGPPARLVKREYQAREGISLSFVPFVMKAVVEALRRQPTFNATWTDEGLLARRRVNLGVAVAVDDGLIVPIVRDVDQLSINGINRAVAELAVRARANRFRTDDFGGGTFTVDNTGWFGSNLTMPIINVPEVAILTMEAITKRPVVLETPQGDVIAIRPIMNMVIGIDHRANDGAQAGFFLRDVKAWLEGIGPDTPIY